MGESNIEEKKLGIRRRKRTKKNVHLFQNFWAILILSGMNLINGEQQYPLSK